MRVPLLRQERLSLGAVPGGSEFAFANHIFHTMTFKSWEARIGGFPSGDESMWVTFEVNVALWGMIFCALHAAEQLAGMSWAMP